MLTFSCFANCLTEGIRPPTGIAPLRIWPIIFEASREYKLFSIGSTSTVFPELISTDRAIVDLYWLNNIISESVAVQIKRLPYQKD